MIVNEFAGSGGDAMPDYVRFHKPQLERAIAVAMEALTENPAPVPAEPGYPNYEK